LAALETFVHLTAADARLVFAAIEILVPDDVTITALRPDRLPANWRAEPPPDETKAVGTGWIRSGASLLLRMPSVIVPREKNYLLNPAHEDFHRLTIRGREPFGFD
jgi:RES domain-containing protein